nr:hypothetical protein [Bacillus toyonensis]
MKWRATTTCSNCSSAIL